MKTYRCKHAVEAMRWTDTDEDRERFAAWFEKHDALFETRGPEVILPEPDYADEVPRSGTVSVGEWVLYSDGEFLAMEHELFVGDYEEIA